MNEEDKERYTENVVVRRPRRTSKAKIKLFLERYKTTANISESCRVSGLSRKVVTYLREHNEEFQEAFQRAHEESVDMLVSECRRRALIGDQVPVGWYRGVPGTWISQRSDILLMFMVKAQLPEYRDKWQVTGANGQPLQISVAAYTAPDGYKGRDSAPNQVQEPEEPAEPKTVGSGPGEPA